MNIIKKSSLAAIGGSLLLAVMASSPVYAEVNPFSAHDLTTVSIASGSGKCGENKAKTDKMKCGEAKMIAAHGGKCGEAEMKKMAAMKAKHGGKCGEGKCGEAKMKAMAAMKAKNGGKCGEAKMKAMAAMKAKNGGKCGEAKMKTHAKKCGQ